MPDAPAPQHLVKFYESSVQDGACGPSEAVALITTNRVDRDGEVVVPEGIDLTNYRRNPIVQYGHAKGLPSEGEAGFPVGVNVWIKPSRDGNGLVAKHAFDLDDPFSARVCGKVKRGFLACYSITFLQKEWGPPTRDEVKRHPEWAKAKTIYRKTELVEYSVVAMPANVDAVTLAKQRSSMSTSETVDAGAAVATPAVEDEPLVAVAATIPEDEPVTKAMPADDGDDDDGDDADDDDGDEDEDDTPPAFKRGDHVKVKAPHFKGCGTVASVHKGEMVPEVDEDMYGSAAEPAARVKVCKRKDGGCAPTAMHKAVMVKHLEMSPVAKPSTKKKAADAAPPAPAGWTEAQTATYLQSRIQAPNFPDLVMQRIKGAVEVELKGRV